MIGMTLAHFRITDKLGEGGMGEVYRAEDTKLGREVALKVLPEAVAADPERLARFEREAKVLASLNHPNIAGIHQIEEAEGKQLLVMELAEGADLTEYIEQGPLPLDRALAIALQITEALEAAHDRGIVHRDLKPANVKVSPDGEVKVLDFGLAKALDPGSGQQSSPSISLSPTLTAQMTQAGVLLGTAAYMSPEQARGEGVDRRADIWAFGVVLMEMLTGKRVYAGKTVSDTLASVLAREPEWDGLPKDLPARVRELLERCLEKEPRERLQAIGEARLAIERYLADPEAEARALATESVAQEPGRRSLLPWILAGVAIAAAVVLGLLNLRLTEEANEPQRLLRTVILPPEGHDWDLDGVRPGRVAISPDGWQLAYSAVSEDGGESMLWIRPLDSSVGRPLPNTENAAYPFWSPDGRHVAFFASGKLKKIAVAGGPPVSLCDATNGKSGSWSRQGTIIYTPTAGAGLFRVPAAGGDCVEVIELDTEAGDISHRHPWFLPDGEQFIYIARRGASDSETVLRVGSLDGTTGIDLLQTPTNAAYASGRLLFIREGTLMAQTFDPARLELSGEAVPLIEQILDLPGAALSVFAVSEAGELVYQTGSSTQKSQVVWTDREGQELGSLGEPADQNQISLTRDSEWAATAIVGEDGQYDIWLYDVNRNLRSRFTFRGGYAPAWSPDGARIAFTSERDGGTDLYLKEVGGTGEAEPLLANSNQKYPYSWTPDGEMVLYQESAGGADVDVLAVPVNGDREPISLVATEFREIHPAVSPDGRWLAYSSNESGRREVYVTTFPEPERKWQVSVDGGRQPAWTRNGGEIVFLKATYDVIYAAEVSAEDNSFRVGAVEKLFDVALRNDPGVDWAVTADGERFVLNVEPERGTVSALHLVVNWPAILEER